MSYKVKITRANKMYRPKLSVNKKSPCDCDEHDHNDPNHEECEDCKQKRLAREKAAALRKKLAQKSITRTGAKATIVSGNAKSTAAPKEPCSPCLEKAKARKAEAAKNAAKTK